MHLGLTGKVFVVTAASGGLGLASARALALEGARVVLVARHSEPLREAASAIGDSARPLVGDLADPAVPQQAVHYALDEFGRVDGALVSVGGPPKGSVLETPDAVWMAAFGSVFLPALRMARAVFRANSAAAAGFVLSTSVKVPLPAMAPSNGLRPGLAMLVKQLADEVGPSGGRAVGLLPGTIATDRITDLYSQSPDPDRARADAEAAIPLRRIGEPAEFGRVAAFVLSDAASYLSGCLIPVDGGALRAC